LALAVRVDGVRITGLEIQPALAALARNSATANDLGERVSFIDGDLLTPPGDLAPGSFDHVIANPPYLAAGTGNPPPDAAKRTATVEGEAALSDWLGFLSSMVADGGTITIVHRFDRADDVVSGLRQYAGDVVVFPLWQKNHNGDAKRVIVQARKGEAKDMAGEPAFAPGLVLHQPDGGYTAMADAILRDGGDLDIPAWKAPP